MKHWKPLLKSLAVCLALGSTLANVRAQEPKAPVHEFLPLIEGRADQNPNDEQTTALQPDNRPLTSAQEATLGTPEMRHSYWVPGFQYASTTRSTSFNQPNVSNWNSTSYLTGNLSLLQAWGHAQLSMNYSGGGGISTDSSQGNNYLHQVEITQTFDWRRWQLQFIDQFAYLPESQFGFGGTTNLSIPGVGGSIAPPALGLQTSYVPSQAVFSSFGPRYSNSVVTQLIYALSPRTSITATGSYGLLHFVKAGNIDSMDAIGSLGYNYALTKKDTLGLLYRFTRYEYSGNPQTIDDHVFNVAYGHKVTGHVALQLFAGPEITAFAIPIANTSNRISASGGATVTYALARGGFSLTYNHGVSNGSGVLAGSNSDQISTSVNHLIGRAWQANINFGYAKNRALAQNQAQNSQSFNSYFMGGGLNRPLGRNATFSLSYTAYIQGISQTVCSPGGCSSSTTQHQISLGFTWHTRPYVLR